MWKSLLGSPDLKATTSGAQTRTHKADTPFVFIKGEPKQSPLPAWTEYPVFPPYVCMDRGSVPEVLQNPS